MIGKLLRTIFLPKETRAKVERAGQRANPGEPQAAKSRDQIMNEAMAIYRKQQRDVYDKLDGDTRREIEEDAAKTFGAAVKGKD